MNTPNDAARPVAKIRVGGGPDPSTVRWITDSPPTTPILVYTAADYDKLREEVERLRDALVAIRQSGSDTLSGRADGGPDDRDWHRDAVREMTRRARIALNAQGESI